MLKIERLEKYLWFSLLLVSLTCGIYRGAFYVSVGLLILLGMVYFIRKPSLEFSYVPAGKSIGIFLGCLFLSVVFSNDFALSLKRFVWLLIAFSPLFIVPYVVKEKKHLELIFQCLAVSLALGSIVAIWQGVHGEVRVKSFMGMMNFAGALGLIFPIILVQSIEYRGALFQRALYWGAVLLALPAAYYNGTRAIWLTMAGTVILYVVIRGREYKKSIAAIILGIILLGAWGNGNSYIIDKVQSMNNTSTNESNIGRINLWNYAGTVFLQHSIIGAGYGALPAFSGEVYKLGEELKMNPEVARNDHVHNNFLQLLAEAGLIGGGSYLFFIGSVLWFLWRWFRIGGANKIPLIGVLVSIDFFFHGMFDYVLSPAGTTLYLYVIILGCVFAGKSFAKDENYY